MTVIRTVKKGLFILVAIICVVILIACASALLKISTIYDDEASVAKEFSQYRPVYVNAGQSANPDDNADIIINQSIYDLQQNTNSDIMGWLSIDGTQVDYPFVRAEDNEFYLHRDIYKDDLYAGSLFADYRCARDLSDFNTIIYGHNMKNHSMFGDLGYFKDQDYFNTHSTGILFLVNGTYKLQIFACMTVSANDPIIYNPSAATAGERSVFMDYVAKNALCYREVADPDPLGVLTLSSCSNSTGNSRVVLLATFDKIEPAPSDRMS